MTIDTTAAKAAIDALAATADQQIAGLTGQVGTLRSQVTALQAQLDAKATGRFPGDPGPGKIVVGAIVSGGAGTADAFEKTNKTKLGAHRAYYNNGISDLAPNGPAMAFIKAEQAAGRVAMVSFKLDWQQVVNGVYDAQIAAWRDAVEATAKPVDAMFGHEPENDGSPAALFVQYQRHLRRLFGRGLKRLSFGGSLMAYDWTAASGRTPDDWFPGNADDGLPTWDWCGLDQYAQTAGNPIEDAKFKAALVSLQKWGVPPCFTELGIRVADPQASALLKQLFEDVVGLGFVKFIYFDSNNNSTGVGWVLAGPLLTQFVGLLNDPRAARPNA